MKIVDRKTFLALPPNTLFCKFKPNIFDDICIKGETLGNDFWYQPINSAVECSGSEEFHNLLFDAAEHGRELEMDFDSQFRDGLFDDEQLFAVWSALDVQKLVARLCSPTPKTNIGWIVCDCEMYVDGDSLTRV